jgi:Ubiquitin family
MLIFVKTLTGKVFIITPEPEDTIDMVKGRIAEYADGAPKDVQRIIFKDRQLEDGRTLSDYGIVNETMIYLIQRLKGF